MLAFIKQKLGLNTFDLFFFFLIIALTLFFKFYLLERVYYMGWDQERDAFVVWQLLTEGKITLIGPRAVGPDGFFLGPLWYYLLAPFYLIANLDPIAGAWFGATVGISTVLAIFIFAKKFLGKKEALITAFCWATYIDRLTWNPILVPLFTLGVIFTLFKIIEGNKKYILGVAVIFGLSLQIHFQAIFFAVPIFITLFFYIRKYTLPTRELFFASALFLATFLPLFIFDLRHNFINIQSFLTFFKSTNSDFKLFANSQHSFEVFIKSITNAFPVPTAADEKFYISLVLFSVLGIIISSLSRAKKLILLTFFLFPPLAFSLYSGNLSEYYFVLCLVPLTIGLASAISAVYQSSFVGKILAVLLLFILLINRKEALLNMYQERSLYYKRQAVELIVTQNMDPIFNVSYSTPYNEDTGFKYLFKIYGREPQNIPEGHLWTIAIPANSEDVAPVATFGDIGVIRR